MIVLNVTKNKIHITINETITSGSVNAYKCQFIFSREWMDLTKTVTFRAGEKNISIILDDNNQCLIPWEVMTTEGIDLYVGICGLRGTGTESTEDDVVLPTIWTLLGNIVKGVSTSGEQEPPTPDVYDQILLKLNALENSKQDKITGEAGQIVGFDMDGNPIAQDNVIADYTIVSTTLVSEGNIAEYQLKNVTTGEVVGDTIAIPEQSFDDTELKADIANKQDKLTAGDNITIANNVISATDTVYDDTSIRTELNNVKTTVASKQDKLTAGSNITIANGVISAKDTVYDDTEIKEDLAGKQDKLTAGSNITIVDNVISAATGEGGYDDTELKKLIATKQDKLKAGTNITISTDNTISAASYDDTQIKKDIAAKQDKLTAGDNITITNGIISATGGGESYDDTEIKEEIATKQDKLTAGENITITGNTISASSYDDTAVKSDITSLQSGKQDKLTAGSNITIVDNVISAASGEGGYDDTAIKADITALQSGKQDKLAAGTNITITDNTISASSYDDTEIKASIAGKQDALIAGTNITITDNTISAASYNDTQIVKDIEAANTAIAKNTSAIAVLNGEGEGSVKKTTADAVAKIVAGAPEDFDTLKEMSDWISSHETTAAEMNSKITDLQTAVAGKQDTLAAGTNITISGNTISASSYDDTDVKADITALQSGKQDKLTAGSNITITNGVISAKDEIGINPNLLINPDFKINQRGQTEYTNTNYAFMYSVDRWKFTAGKVTIKEDGVNYASNTTANTFHPRFIQLTERTLNKDQAYTVSAKIKLNSCNGRVQFRVCNSAYGQLGTSAMRALSIDDVGDERIISFSFVSDDNYSNVGVEFLCASKDGTTTNLDVDIYWVKLELGSVATPFIHPDPMVEVLKCGSIEDTTQVLLSEGHWSNIPSNPNLLINPDFKINQRGKTEYVFDSTAKSYHVDHWFTGNPVAKTTVLDKGIKVACSGKATNGPALLQQAIENSADLIGKTVTLTVNVRETNAVGARALIQARKADGTSVYPITASLKNGINTWSTVIPSDASVVAVWIYGADPREGDTTASYSIIDWVKLELGSISTPFAPPDPIIELTKCQRYYQKLYNQYSYIGNGYIAITSRAIVSCPIATMYKSPKVTITGKVYILTKGHSTDSNAFQSTALASSVSIIPNAHSITFPFSIQATEDVVGYGCIAQFRDADSCIELEAEL